MVGVDGSSPFAPTKIGNEKGLAEMPSPLSLAVRNCNASSPQWQIQGQLRVYRGLEPEVHVEGFGSVVLRIHDQCIGSHLLPCLQAAIDSTAQQQLAEPAALLVRSTGESAHAKARNRVARQFLALCLGEPLPIDFGRAQGVVAQDSFGLRRARQHEDGADAAAPVLFGETMEVLVECGYTAVEPLPIVQPRVERQIVKHAELCGAPASVLP